MILTRRPIPAIIICIAIVLFSCVISAASEQETDLFNRGYEYLFSYKPDKAAETFRQFLNDFPNSSARDAAIFWLGKTLISLKSFDEASRMFETLRKEFPDSPYILFLDIESEEIARSRSSADIKPAAARQTQPKPETDAQLSRQYEIRIKELEKKAAETSEELERSKTALAAEKKALAEQQAKLTETEAQYSKRNTEAEILSKKIADLEQTIRSVAAEKLSLEAEKKKAEAERDDLRLKAESLAKSASSDTAGPLNKKIGELENRLNAALNEKSGLSAELEKTAIGKKQAEAERDELGIKAKSLEQRLSVDVAGPLNKKIGELESRANTLESELSKLKKERETLIRSADDEKRTASDLKALLEKMRSEEKTIRDAADKTTEKQLSLQEKIETYRKENTILTSQIKAAKTESEKLANLNQELSGQIATLENQARQKTAEKTAAIESRDSLLKKKESENEALNRQVSELEKSTRKLEEDRKRLDAQLSQAASAKKQAEAERDELGRKIRSDEEKLRTDASAAINRQISELESRSRSLESEISKIRQERDSLARSVAEEKKISSDLASTNDKLRSREKELLESGQKAAETNTSDKTSIMAKESENRRLVQEVLNLKSAAEQLADTNRTLSARIEDMEEQAAQRLKDMKILNSYLSKLMFKNSSEQKNYITVTPAPKSVAVTEPITAEKKIQAEELARYSTNSALALHKTGISSAFWRVGSPLNDFINEEMLFMESERKGIRINNDRLREITKKNGLSDAESDYLRKAVQIAALIDMEHKGHSDEPAVEILSVEYKPGNAASKTVLATDLQKAARSGRSFRDIKQSYNDSVGYSRMTIKEFGNKYKEKSQLINKLDFLKNETVVMWSERGYMLIKPMVLETTYDPLSVLLPENREKLRELAMEYIKNLKK